MASFSETVKYSSISPARKATLAEAQNANLPFDKYYSISNSRKIDRINLTIALPAYTRALTSGDYWGRLLSQYNITVGESFYILNRIVQDSNLKGLLTVKWRVGSTVHRYGIQGNKQIVSRLIPENVANFAWYSNQLVPSKCSFEYWIIRSEVSFLYGLASTFNIKTSLLYEPESASVTAELVSPDPVVVPTDVDLPITEFPVALDSNVAYLDNV